MVPECSVLLGVEDLEQSGRRVSIVRVAAQLVDLVKHDDAVGCATLLDSLQDEAREGADVRTTMAAHLCLRVDPTHCSRGTQRQCCEVAWQGHLGR